MAKPRMWASGLEIKMKYLVFCEHHITCSSLDFYQTMDVSDLDDIVPII